MVPEHGGEELRRVHVGDGEAGGSGKLPHHGQHSDHYGQIWGSLWASHMTLKQPVLSALSPPNRWPFVPEPHKPFV